MKSFSLKAAVALASSVLLAAPVLTWRQAAVAKAAAPAAAGAQTAAAPAPDVRPAGAPYQVGIASWYGPHFQGRPTSSGQLFNMYRLSAAHRTLPLGTRVRVTNLENHRSVVLRINDRGPVPKQRIIDLSYAAATDLGFRAEGLAPVRIDVLPPPAQVSSNVPPALPGH